MKRLYDLGIEERLRVKDQVAAILATEPRVAFAYLYGSFAESQPFHDIDVGVHLSGTDPDHDMPFSVVLAQRLSERVTLPVDVRILNEAPVSFLHHVLRGKVLVSHDDDLLGDVLEDTIRRYLDMAPLLRRSAKEAFAE
jgi:predicted nucleotidyltransferase